MSLRDTLKQREEQREAAQSGGEFPEGVTRYVRMGKHGEVNTEGRTFVILADPDDWFAYYVHEQSTFNGQRTIYHFRKHTCLHSPKGIRADQSAFKKPNPDACPSCLVGAPRKLYAMIPVYDLEYKTYRVIDTKEFHINNLIADYDKAEKMGRKFNPDYTLVGEAVHIKQVDKSFSLESGDASPEQLEEAKKFIGIDYGYEELANFREESDIIKLLHEADEEAKIDRAKLPPLSESTNEKDNEEIDEETLPF
ncbi:single-stranded DNA-binding protein [Bacillus paralicheniformis]|uniref:single-stranded DNA-binding protein n=1 Tax=Bacillus paralicheniformis TaxID=1648923 RepID=UPI00237CA7A2|nr:single-stranded DNA-binding protein [Bacillus paralicheniformis]MDE1383279.1 single-stranded DNA-binding protein [Bacillus paralicheniformis]MED4309214.1 single-stranded DNA-binding protein [Bacillus paralicheniformis]MED4346898.1 single-stranded DNA-binding protein [Bacillus paralicheniformis]